jgi:hypothetical protein
MYYITILDFESGKVLQYNLNNICFDNVLEEWQSEDFEQFILDEGFKLSNIEWMSHSDNTINYF